MSFCRRAREDTDGDVVGVDGDVVDAGGDVVVTDVAAPNPAVGAKAWFSLLLA